MAKLLRLYNSYSHSIKEAKLASGQIIDLSQCNASVPIRGSMYICGPTVYSDSHLGHALTYVRADVFRRTLKSIFNIQLTTVMNITDIDDKILNKVRENVPADSKNPPTNPESHPFNRLSDKYYKSFLNDMNYINVTPPDITVKVSKQVGIISDYIRRLEKKGHAYLAENGDVYFDITSVKNYNVRNDDRLENQSRDNVKRHRQDFALWKAAKPGEPVWSYRSDVTGKVVPGRPGWHVQCSAICSAIFGNQLDFHYGGKDLIFPHHYNEQACCCAYHSLDTSDSFHVWSRNWLHSGHLVLKDEKMSKSLGNIVGIRDFIKESSVNALRLLCMAFHYRADVNFNNELLENMKSLDHKLCAFLNYISDGLAAASDTQLETFYTSDDLDREISRVRNDITDGICDDLDFAKGLHSILDLSKLVYNTGLSRIRPKDLAAVWHLLVDWTCMCGLDYSAATRSLGDLALVDLVKNFRNETRNLVIQQMKRNKMSKESLENEDVEFLKNLLKNCDDIRSRMDEIGFIVRDGKS